MKNASLFNDANPGHPPPEVYQLAVCLALTFGRLTPESKDVGRAYVIRDLLQQRDIRFALKGLDF
ncbi:hypothetical protein [Brevundimonas sp.]|uniref:hypothetical protein n=1 Tax=Brevundimonas sp. TaxID=1871086 RepID=UPI0025BE8617|nr:hypothetical protein [Brevundimonas sp.]